MLWWLNDDKVFDLRVALLKFIIALEKKKKKKPKTGIKQAVEWFVILEGEIRSQRYIFP